LIDKIHGSQDDTAVAAAAAITVEDDKQVDDTK